MSANKPPKKTVTESDSKLFRQAFAAINQPPDVDTVVDDKNDRAYRNKNNIGNNNSLSSGVLIDNTAAGEYSVFARGGLQQKIIRKLKRGEYQIADSIDLHGLTKIQAAHELAEFLSIHRARQSGGGQSVLHIIHGKGLRSGEPGGILKPSIYALLKQHPAVLAFCSALPKDGGSGAVYVLLRR